MRLKAVALATPLTASLLGIVTIVAIVVVVMSLQATNPT